MTVSPSDRLPFSAVAMSRIDVRVERVICRSR
jgi:hypothetical protein